MSLGVRSDNYEGKVTKKPLDDSIIDSQTLDSLSVSNAGDNFGIIAGRDVIINQELSRPPKVKAVVPVGPEHITNEQRVLLKNLVADVVRLESIARREPKSFASVWSSLNKKCKASEYKLILRKDFPKAEKYLREWIGRLSSTKTAQRKDVDWRKRKYNYIHTNCKQFGLGPKMREFIRQRFQTDSQSLTELDNEQLTVVYNAVARWKKDIERS